MTTQKTLLTLPPDVVRAFIGLESEKRDAYVVRLRALSWTLQSIADAADLTRERVRQLSVRGADSAGVDLGDLPLPKPPERRVKAKPVYVEPDPDKLAEALRLQPMAQQVRSNSPRFREEAEAYTKLLNEMHSVDGVTLYRLAKRLGITHAAVRFRLARYGYKPQPKGTSKVYKPIMEKNRAEHGTD